MATKAVAQFDSARRLTETSTGMIGSKTGALKEELRKALKNVCLIMLFRKREIEMKRNRNKAIQKQEMLWWRKACLV